MRSVTRLIGVLAAVLLFAVPVLGISAQGGQLSVTGRWDDGIFVPSNLPAPGETELTIGELAPSALPVTGSWDDGIFVPSNLPAPGETELTIGELNPSALPPTGTSAQSTGCAQFWGMTDPDGFYSHECDNGAALPGTTAPSARTADRCGAQCLREYSVLGHDDPDGFYSHECDNAGALPGTTRPHALPQSGADQGGLTGHDRQTMLNEIADGVRNITEILPEELAAVGR